MAVEAQFHGYRGHLTYHFCNIRYRALWRMLSTCFMCHITSKRWQLGLYEPCSKCQVESLEGFVQNRAHREMPALSVRERLQGGWVDRMLQFSTLVTTFQNNVKIRKDFIMAGYHNRGYPLFSQSFQDMPEQNLKQLSPSYAFIIHYSPFILSFLPIQSRWRQHNSKSPPPKKKSLLSGISSKIWAIPKIALVKF